MAYSSNILILISTVKILEGQGEQHTCITLKIMGNCLLRALCSVLMTSIDTQTVFCCDNNVYSTAGL